jgi:hypothetical protein
VALVGWIAYLATNAHGTELMPAPVIALRDAVADALAAELTPATFEKRWVAYMKRADVAEGKWVVTPAGDDRTTAAKAVVKSNLVVDVIWQIALPDSTDTALDPLTNNAWFHEQMDRIETVKELFATDGDLRDEQFAGFDFLKLTNSPIYRPDLLTDYQIFTSVVRLEFLGEV